MGGRLTPHHQEGRRWQGHVCLPRGPQVCFFCIFSFQEEMRRVLLGQGPEGSGQRAEPWAQPREHGNLVVPVWKLCSDAEVWPFSLGIHHVPWVGPQVPRLPGAQTMTPLSPEQNGHWAGLQLWLNLKAQPARGEPTPAQAATSHPGVPLWLKLLLAPVAGPGSLQAGRPGWAGRGCWTFWAPGACSPCSSS